jgi:hypothetical protein
MTDFDDLEAWARNMRGSFLAATTHDEQLAVFDRVLRRLVTAELRLETADDLETLQANLARLRDAVLDQITEIEETPHDRPR